MKSNAQKTDRIFDACIERFRACAPAGDPIVIGFSGGPDSVFLATVALAARPDRSQIVLAHLDHGLRPESGRDARWARDTARQMGVGFVTQRTAVRQLARRNGQSVETAARAARHAFFLSISRNVFLAHHRDDLIETLLDRLATGTSAAKWASLSEYALLEKIGLRILRPLVRLVSKKELRDWLDRNGVPYLEDPSNADRKYRRNVIRHRVVPLLSELNPSFGDKLVRLADETARLTTTVGETAENFIRERAEKNAVRVAWHSRDAAWLPKIVRQAIFREAYRLLGGNLRAVSARQFEIADKIALAGGKTDLPGGLMFERNGERTGVFFRVNPAAKKLPQLVTKKLRHDPKDFEKFLTRKDEWVERIDAGKTRGRLRLGFARSEDEFHPFGRTRTKNVMRYLKKRGVPRDERSRAVVCRDADGIVWVVGQALDERRKVSENTADVWELKIANPAAQTPPPTRR